MNQLQFKWNSTDLFTEVSNTFVIVTAHKQVCANQKKHGTAAKVHHVCPIRGVGRLQRNAPCPAAISWWNGDFLKT